MKQKYIIIIVVLIIAFALLFIYSTRDVEEPELNLTGSASFGNTTPNDFGNKIHIDCEWLSENPKDDLIVNQSKASELCMGFFPSLNWTGRLTKQGLR